METKLIPQNKLIYNVIPATKKYIILEYNIHKSNKNSKYLGTSSTKEHKISA